MYRKFPILILLLVTVSNPPSIAQETAGASFRDSLPARVAPADTSYRFSSDDSVPAVPADGGVSATRLAIVGGVMVGAMVGVHLYQESGWWKYNRAPFHFREDLTYGRSVDKIGHVYGTMLWAYGLRRTLEWTNMAEESALYYASGGALAWQTFVEIEDGLSAWGFDRVDFLCDVAGAAWPIGRHHVPFLRNFDLKLSYRPSPLLNQHGGGGFAGQKHLVIDDYEGQTFWLALRMTRLLPDPIDGYWPGFLNFAVGYGVRDVSGDPYSVVFIGLDYDMKEIIPQTSPFLRTLSDILNFIHLPAPAIRISPATVFYGLYY